MGLALDTVLYDVHNAATSAIGLTAATLTNSGDPAQIRSFPDSAFAKLVAATLHGSGTRQARITSPRMHDNVTGLTFQSPETPTEFLFPPEVGEPMYSVDTLAVSADAAASSDSLVALLVYYSNLPGIDAQLKTWAEVKSRMIRLKVMQVAVTTSATPGTWADTVITTTENQLKADYEYALLGFEPNAALTAIGLKGPATGNLRVCAPGTTETTLLTNYFIWMGERHGLPFIPVFKSNDRGATNISSCSQAASVTANVYAILAQLA
jgi:hypothetical protein